MEDSAIIELYWARDEGAIAQTDLKYGTFCRKLAFNVLSSNEDSEECVNDTWHRAWDTMPPQRPDSLRAYLGRIVRNLSISRLRQRTAQKRGGGLEIMLSELGDCLPAPQSVERETEAKELAGVISAWLRGLSDDDRRCSSAATGTATASATWPGNGAAPPIRWPSGCCVCAAP